MNKNIVIVLLLIASLGLMGYVVYDEFGKDELKECNKEELCDECVCDDDFETDGEDYFDIKNSGIYTKDGKIYRLSVFTTGSENAEAQNIKLNNKSFKIEKKDDILYVNDKKVNHADILYLTDNYIISGVACQNGMCLMNAITEKGDIIDLNNNVKPGEEFQTEELFLTEKGTLVAIGGPLCGLDCSRDEEIIEFSYNNGKFEINKNN